MADWTPQSRAEEILFNTINGEPYDGLPQSRIEELLLELKEVIEEGGGGGGGTTNYNQLQNLPQINGTTLKGNKTTTDLGLSSVEANPTGEAAGELISIGIDGNKYSIPESSEYKETTVWTGSGNMLSSFTATIADPYTDYDALRFEYESRNSSQNYATHYERLISKETLGTTDWFSISDFFFHSNAGVNTAGKFTDGTHLSVMCQVSNWFTSCTLTKIVGIKYGNGVSSGGASIEHVTLSDTVIDSTGSHSLSGDYTEFDQIEVWLASPGYTSQECECVIIGVDTLKDMMDENRTYTISAFGTRFINLTFGSSAINISNMSDLNIIKIVGVRFGGSGGGGGTSDYSQLQNKPQINGVTLTGDKTASDLDLVDEDDELTTAQMSALIALLD